ncbi:MAG: clostripain-related cysteine peptidase [Chloroflexota bacterium]
MLTNTIVVSHTYAGFGGTNIIADHTLFHNIGSTPCDSGAICTNNISGDPKFIDPTNGDYRLGSGSAAIDAGIDAGVADDIAGVARPVGSAPDIGAYEYTFCNDVTEIPELECEALVGLYNSTAGLQWLDAKDWLTSNTPCSWGYVTCAAGHVTELVMPNNGLRGDMPAALGNLSQLTHLDLSGNQLSGNVPATLGNLSNLQTLTLQGNPLTGSLPESLQDVRLQDFHFQATNLCTPISSAFELWLADIPNLTSTETPCLLHLTKDVSVDTAAPNETVTYKIAISATSQTTVQVTDTLPAGITNITNLSPEAIYDSEAHQIRYTGDVSPETPVALTYAGTTASTLGAGSILYNEAVATAMGTTVEDSATIVVPIGEHTSKTLLLIYGGGDNELHDDLYDLLNRAELAANNPNVAIMMLLDGAGADDTVVFQIAPDTNLHCPNQHNPTCGGRYTYGKNLWSWTDNTASPYSLSEFIQTGMRIYPDVDQVMLSLVGHGAGWAPNKRFAQPPIVDIQPNYLGGLLIDHHPYRSLSTAALGNALKWVYEETGRKIDLVYFDACSMGMWEVAYEVSPYVHYQMFSANTAWAAFPYDQHINAIDGKKDVAEIGQAWIQNEISALNGDYPFTFSLVESSKLSVIQDALTEVSDGLIQTLDADGDTTRGKLRTVFDDTERFESNYDGYINEYDNYSDLSSFATELVKQFPSLDNQAKTLQTAISEAVIFQKHGSGRPWVYFSEPPYPDKSFWQWNQIGGIGIYMPFNQDHDEWKRQFYTDAHIKTAETGRWDELIAAFWDGLDAAQQRTSRTETQETQPPICPPDCDGMGAPLSLMPTLLMPVEAQTTYSQSINIPIDLELYGNTLTEGKFIVEFDNTCLAVDPAKIEFVDATGTATLENANQLVLTGIQSSGSSTLHQGQLVNMPVTAICEPDARTSITISVTITSVTFTDNQAATIPGTAVDGVITIRSTAIEGDINGDEAVNIFDLQILINMITNDVPADPDLYPLEQWERAELNGDGGWNIFDLQLLINLITQ